MPEFFVVSTRVIFHSQNLLYYQGIVKVISAFLITNYLILYLKGFDTNQFFCIDNYYNSNRPAYYRALQNVDQKTLDLTNWLEYFVEGVYVNTQAVKERVIRLSSERLKKTRRGQIALTERQMRVIEFINKNDRITNRDIRSMFKLSDESALREINKLLSLGVIKKRDKGRATHYIIK